MVTRELSAGPALVGSEYRGEEQSQAKIAREQIPFGPTALIVILFDLLIKLDPR